MATDKPTGTEKPGAATTPASLSHQHLIEMAAALGVLAERKTLSDQDRQEAHVLLETLGADAECRVRAAVSRAISGYPLLPPGLAQKLAQDVLEVSGPMLEHSPVLSDAFLVNQIAKDDTSDEVQQQIAKRRNLSYAVTDTLIKSGASIAVETVLENQTARISDDSLLAVFHRDDLSGKMVSLVAQRDDLSTPIVSRCHEIILADQFDREVGQAVRKRLVKTYALPESMAKEIVDAALEDALTRATIGAGSVESELELLARHLHKHGDLTASLLLRMVCAGSLDFARATYRVLTGESLDQINMAFYGAGNDSLSELYQASGLDPYFRFAVTTAIKTMAEEERRKSKSEPDKPVNEIVREIVGFYRGIAPTSIEQVIASLSHEADRWRQPEPTPESAS